MRVAVYARVSNDRQREEQTVASQLEEIRELAAREGWTLDDRHIYIDDGHSGFYFDRPGLDRLRDAARDGLLDLLVIERPSSYVERIGALVNVFSPLATQPYITERVT